MRSLKHQGVLSDIANGLPTVFQRSANALPTGCVFPPHTPALEGPPVGRRPQRPMKESLLAGWQHDDGVDRLKRGIPRAGWRPFDVLPPAGTWHENTED
jgi:hypothetical protein